MSQATIGIVGGAVSGSVFALQILSHPVLKKLYKPIIYEQQSPLPSWNTKNLEAPSDDPLPVLHTAGAAVGIFPNGLFSLYELGIRTQFDEISCSLGQIDVWRGRLDGSHHFYNSTLNQGWAADLQTCPRAVERHRLQALLLARVQELGGEVLWNKKAQFIKSLDTGRARVTFSDGESAEVDLLIGADGAWSPVRRFILHQRYNNETAEKRWVPKFTGIVGIYGISSVDWPSPKSLLSGVDSQKALPLVLLDQGNIGALLLEDGKIAWTMHLPEPTAPDRSTPIKNESHTKTASLYERVMVPGVYDPASTAKILQNHENVYHPTFGTWQHVFQASDRIIRSPLRLAVWDKEEIQWRNIVLVGDAARVLPPYSGQGSSFGIEDATVLANALLNNPPSLTAKCDFRAALEEYADYRVPRSKKAATLASWAGIIGVGERWWWRWIRDIGARLPVMGGDPRKYDLRSRSL